MFIPRHPVVENQFCSYQAQDTDATGVGGVLCYAGSVLKLNSGATNQEAIVSKVVDTDTDAWLPFGFAMQKVKTGYHQVHPAGFMMPGDLGSSDVIAQPAYTSGAIAGTKEAPLGVAHLGIWDTVHYTATMVADVVSAGLTPGMRLYTANDEAKVTYNITLAANPADLTTGEAVNTTIVAKVVKGASVAKCQANIDNTTLYPIRIKLLI